MKLHTCTFRTTSLFTSACSHTHTYTSVACDIITFASLTFNKCNIRGGIAEKAFHRM